MAAAIIRPYVRAEVTWILEMHGVFQMYYYADKIGLNKHERERWRDHHWLDGYEKFCRDWDQVSFDPFFPSKPLDYFIPLIYKIFSRPAFSHDIMSSDA
jgi:predicted HD phosphohydrolase